MQRFSFHTFALCGEKGILAVAAKVPLATRQLCNYQARLFPASHVITSRYCTNPATHLFRFIVVVRVVGLRAHH
jgi:hypothetical protein